MIKKVIPIEDLSKKKTADNSGRDQTEQNEIQKLIVEKEKLQLELELEKEKNKKQHDNNYDNTRLLKNIEFPVLEEVED